MSKRSMTPRQPRLLPCLQNLLASLPPVNLRRRGNRQHRRLHLEQLELRAVLTAVTPLDILQLTEATGTRIHDTFFNDDYGFSQGPAGDVNGDGYDDLVVAGEYRTGPNTVDLAAYVIYGRNTASVNIDFDVIASNLHPTFRLFGSPNPSDAPYTKLRYGLATVTDAVGFPATAQLISNPTDLTIKFGGNTVNSTPSLLLTSFDDGVADGLANQLFEPGAGADNTMTLRQNGVAVATGIVQRVRIDTDTNQNSTGIATIKFTASAGADPTIFNEIMEVTGGEGVLEFELGTFTFEGLPFPNSDASEFVSTGHWGTVKVDLNLPQFTSRDGFIITSPAATEFPFSARGIGDFNGDGFDDVAVSFDDFSAATPTSRIEIVYGRASFPFVNATTSPNGTTLTEITNLAGYTYYGGIGSSGDVNGDGLSDLTVSVLDTETFIGTAYVIFGRTNPGAQIDATTLNGTNGFKVSGEDFLSQNSADIAGDINGDGLDDVLFSLFFTGDANVDANLCGQVVFGKKTPFASQVDLTTLDGSNGFTISDLTLDSFSVGGNAEAVGDVNGDGYTDVAVAVEDEFGRSMAIALGHAGPFNAVHDLTSGANTLSPFVVTNQFGRAGDTNGDGRDDVSATAFVDNDGILNPANVIMFGANSLFAAPENADGNNGFALTRIEYSTDESLFYPDSAGDTNGDGFDDALIGLAADFFAFSPGVVVLVRGGPFTANAASFVGDHRVNVFNGSSAAEQMIGGTGDDGLRGNGGADVLRGGQGNDTLTIRDTTFRQLDGGRGTDALVLDGAGITLDLTAIPDAKIRNLEVIDLSGSGANTLTLSVQEVLNISDSSNRLLIGRNNGDTVNIGSGWTSNGTQRILGLPYDNLTSGQALLLVQKVSPWQSAVNKLFVDPDDSDTTAIDVKLVIDELNEKNFSGADGALPETLPPGYTGPLFDTNGDGFLTAADAIPIINYLNDLASGAGEADILASTSSGGVSNGNVAATATITPAPDAWATAVALALADPTFDPRPRVR